MRGVFHTQKSYSTKLVPHRWLGFFISVPHENLCGTTLGRLGLACLTCFELCERQPSESVSVSEESAGFGAGAGFGGGAGTGGGTEGFEANRAAANNEIR